MRYSEDFIERVRAGNNIEDVISGYVKLQRKGSSYMGLCPFHNEKTPSFSVHPARQTYHCFGCGASGDVFNFLMEYDKLSFQEAVRTLAVRAGIEIPNEELTGEQKKEASERSRLLDIQKEAAKFYLYKLHSPSGRTAMEYLKNRGLSDEIIKGFGLGYSGKDRNGLYPYLKKKGYTDALLKESGLFTWDEKRSVMNDKFWNRVMFPIMDINRKVIGFGGRVFGDAKPKYLNSPETKLFDKSRNLYGLYAARTSRQKQIIICEGYMDVISMHQAGFTNAVASLGTALTSQQAALLHRYTKDVLLLYDSDEAGVKAALRGIPLLRNAGLNSKVVNLKPFKDPDELLKAKGHDELADRIEKAENGFMFELRILYENSDMKDPQGSSAFYHSAAERLMTFTDEIERNSYIEVVSRTYNIPQDVLKRQISKLAMKGAVPKEELMVSDKPYKKREKTQLGDKAEKTLLSWLCKKPELWKEAASEITPGDFGMPMNRDIAERLFKMYTEGNFNPVSILNRFEESSERSEAAAIIEGALLPEREEDIYKAVMEAVFVVKEAALKRKAENIDPTDMSALQELMQDKKKLEELRKNIIR
ncbi:MAG: DNA primase [Candidatus Alectryocaccobium sp.]|nr:DNA primase [Candidatus Alectryocaccobium sp.]